MFFCFFVSFVWVQVYRTSAGVFGCLGCDFLASKLVNVHSLANLEYILGYALPYIPMSKNGGQGEG